MWLEVKTKQKKIDSLRYLIEIHVVYVRTRKAYHNSKRQAERSWGKHDVTVPIATGYKENKLCHGSKKGGVAKNL